MWDVKINFKSKAWLVANGDLVDAPPWMTYVFLVSRYSFRLDMMLSSLNDWDILCAYIHNIYLNTKPNKKVNFEAAEDFGTSRIQAIVIVRILYGLKGSVAAW